MNYNELAQEIYAQNKAVGWWDEPNRCKLTLLQLVNTEIAEATEAERKNLMDDHLPHRKGGEVELADAMIRLLDMAGAYGWIYHDVRDRGDTDGQERSGLKLRTDHGTGCQYLETVRGGITPRMKDDTHVGCSNDY